MIWAGLIFWLTAQTAQDPVVMIQNALDRVKFGKNPCFTESCQIQKAALSEKIFTLTSKFPFLNPQQRQTASRAREQIFFLISSPPLTPEHFELKKLSDWKRFWQRRSNGELSWYLQWWYFAEQISAESSNFKRLEKIIKDPSIQIPLASLLEDGLLELASSWMAMTIAQRSGNEELAKSLYEKSETLKQGLPPDWEQRLRNLFPDFSFHQIITLLRDYHAWIKQNGLRTVLDNQQVPLISQRLALLKEIEKAIQSFHDLEFGVVGINNFKSFVNPALRTQSEVEIQKKLDDVDSLLRSLAMMGASITVLVLAETGLPPFLARAAAGAAIPASSLYADDWTSNWLPQSDHRGQLLTQIPDLESQMQQRWDLLQKTLALLEKKQQSLKIKRDAAQGPSANGGE